MQYFLVSLIMVVFKKDKIVAVAQIFAQGHYFCEGN